MACKVHAKTLSAYEQKLKQARHERRQAKQQSLSVAELPTKEQSEEMLGDVFASLNVRIRAIVEVEHPNLLPLVGGDWFQTVKHISDAGMLNTLKEAMLQCDEEVEQLFGLSVLSTVDIDA